MAASLRLTGSVSCPSRLCSQQPSGPAENLSLRNPTSRFPCSFLSGETSLRSASVDAGAYQRKRSAPTRRPISAQAIAVDRLPVAPAKPVEFGPTLPVVNSHNEWSLLEEVIVGSVQGATVPVLTPETLNVVKPEYHQFFRDNAGRKFPQHLIDAAAKELDYLAEVLTREGVKVRRPDIPREDEFCRPVQTPDFEIESQMYGAMPRDVLIVVGNEIIEAPMAYRQRFFEYRPFRQLCKEYFRQGAKWTAAPKPLMGDDLYADNAGYTAENGDRWDTTEAEPIFDAAEFMRFGRDIFTQRSSVTNYAGIQWMQRHLGDEYKVHVLDFKQGPGTMHLDADFVPLAPGKLLLNPARPCLTGEHRSFYKYDGKQKELRLPAMFKGWDVFMAPTPRLSFKENALLFLTSPWIATANVLSIDEKRVLVEAEEVETIQAFKSWGFEPIPVPFRSFMPFGGAFHCATLDVRRRSTLESYF